MCDVQFTSGLLVTIRTCTNSQSKPVKWSGRVLSGPVLAKRKCNLYLWNGLNLNFCQYLVVLLHTIHHANNSKSGIDLEYSETFHLKLHILLGGQCRGVFNKLS